MWVPFLLVMGVLGAVGSEPVWLMGDPAWTEPLAPMLASRLGTTVRVHGRAAAWPEDAARAWLVRVTPCAEDACLDVIIVEPGGAQLVERWAQPAGSVPDAMGVRSLAAWLASVLQHEAERLWQKDAGPTRRPVAVAVPATLETAPPAPGRGPIYGVGVGLGLLGDPEGDVGAAMEVRGQRSLGARAWTGFTLGFELRHTVAEAPMEVRRWALPVRWLLGLTHAGPWWRVEAGAGPALRLVRLQVRSLPVIERVSLGGALEAAALWHDGPWALGVSTGLLGWLRRQQLRAGHQVLHRDPHLQVWGGLVGRLVL